MDNQINNQEPINQEPITQEPIIETPVIPETPTVEPTLRDFGITPKPPQNNIFKIIFIFSLIIFILTASAFAFVYYKSQKKSPSTNNSPSTISPVPTPSGTCFLNDKTYQTGESFASADGCNTCSCQSQDMIVCTEKACLSTTPATTNSATISAVPKDWKTYTNSTYKYSIQYPNTWILKANTNKNISLETLEHQKAVSDIQKSGSMGGEPDGSYIISCFKDIKEYSVIATQKSTQSNSLSDYFAKNIPDTYSLIKKTTINNFNTYEVEMKGMGDGNKGFFIENTNSYFCVISLKYKELTNIENQFINTFKFN